MWGRPVILRTQVGVGNAETWELCYSAKKHGWSSSQFRSRCYNKGPLFLMQKRGGYIFGGNVHMNIYDDGRSYWRTATNEPRVRLSMANAMRALARHACHCTLRHTPGSVSFLAQCSP